MSPAPARMHAWSPSFVLLQSVEARSPRCRCQFLMLAALLYSGSWTWSGTNPQIPIRMDGTWSRPVHAFICHGRLSQRSQAWQHGMDDRPSGTALNHIHYTFICHAFRRLLFVCTVHYYIVYIWGICWTSCHFGALANCVQCFSIMCLHISSGCLYVFGAAHARDQLI